VRNAALHIDPLTDQGHRTTALAAYIGTFYSSYTGGLANGYLSRNNLATTAGIRFRF
jgi:hypothetical protein